MLLEENKAIVRRHFEELWTKGDLAVADEIYSPAAVGHCRSFPDQVGYPGSEQENVSQDRIAFPDGVATLEDQVAEGDKVVTRWRFEGTHEGELYGIPATGRRVSVGGFHVHRVVDGKIVEIWALGDFYGLMEQLDVLPTNQAEAV